MLLLSDRVTDSAWYGSIKDRCTYTGMSNKATVRAHTISLQDQQLLLLTDFGHFIHSYSLVVKFPSFCLLAIIALPQTRTHFFFFSLCAPWWQITCVMCGCVYMVVLGTLLHCLIYYCIDLYDAAWRDWLTGDMETLHRWSLNPSISSFHSIPIAMQCKRASII